MLSLLLLKGNFMVVNRYGRGGGGGDGDSSSVRQRERERGLIQRR